MTSPTQVTLYPGDCLDVLRTLPESSVDAVVTDPPYGLSFMGKKWDYSVPSIDIWREVFRVLKPGGHLLAFAGTRTQHRMCVNIEDAGFEIRDMIAWVYGQGFPKSQNVSLSIDKQAGAERTQVKGVKPGHESFAGRGKSGVSRSGGSQGGDGGFHRPWMDDVEKANAYHIELAPVTDGAKQWDGWGTALKPALEPITVARKPLVGTVAANVLKYGVGAINIDGCRVATEDNLNGGAYSGTVRDKEGGWQSSDRSEGKGSGFKPGLGEFQQPPGRFPANLIHDGSDEVLSCFPDAPGQQGDLVGHSKDRKSKGIFSDMKAERNAIAREESEKSAARFFYCAKASKAERGEGCTHPTVKPIALMRYLCRLVTPPGGTVLDPFTGSGTTGIAAMQEGFNFIGIEREQQYYELAQSRLASAYEKAFPT